MPEWRAGMSSIEFSPLPVGGPGRESQGEPGTPTRFPVCSYRAAVGMCDLYFAGIGGEVPGGPYDTTGDCVTGLKELSY